MSGTVCSFSRRTAGLVVGVAAVALSVPPAEWANGETSRRTLQLLRATTRGKFSTRGRYAAATVRGTTWTTADRCDGTFVHDITDSVSVSDFVHHKTVILHAGQSYLAKKP